MEALRPRFAMRAGNRMAALLQRPARDLQDLLTQAELIRFEVPGCR